MSHVAKVNLDVLSLDDLEAACKALGCTYNREATAWRWWGSWQNGYSSEQAAYKNGIEPSRYGKADAGVITVPGASWDIGVYQVPGETNRWCLVYDNFGSRGQDIEKVCGKGLVALKERYGALVTTKQLTAKGFKVTEHKHEQTGRLQLVATRLPR